MNLPTSMTENERSLALAMVNLPQNYAFLPMKPIYYQSHGQRALFHSFA
jgi:hypothetical protein